MSDPMVRVRFAPSPTGGLHLGGVRTALFNYLFAKKNNGKFVLRIEDTDQGRFVPGAEDYIVSCLGWCGILPDEGPHAGGPYGPYRQSERKERYFKHALSLIEKGFAYYAFDTPEELEQMRKDLATTENPNPQYGARIRMQMKNSLSLDPQEVQRLLQQNVPYVIRINMPEGKEVVLNDMIRGEVRFDTGQLDDKVLMKADGMPTYHLAVVVDDHDMEISHAFRGEEWLPSAPIHILLWEYLGWKEKMPQWAHLPLILKPDGQGKLSKRDGDRLGFPVFAMDWKDPKTGELTKGFREMGFLPEAFVNMLAMMGWNDGSGEEIMDLETLAERFSVERIHKAGARFDFEKAKWFNQEWIRKTDNKVLTPHVHAFLKTEGIEADPNALPELIGMVKERCHLLGDFFAQLSYFFRDPEQIDLDTIRPKWDDKKKDFFYSWKNELALLTSWNAPDIETSFKSACGLSAIKPGDVQLPFRIMLVGGKFGPPVFEIAFRIGKEATLRRINHTLSLLT